MKAEHELLTAAAEAARRAYAPYSRFSVGAAVEAEDGTVFTGCNVENASFGLTVCAERAAILAAVSAGRRSIVQIAVVTGAPAPAMPCGSCLQVLAEFARGDCPVLLAPASGLGAPVRLRLADLLPHPFSLKP